MYKEKSISVLTYVWNGWFLNSFTIIGFAKFMSYFSVRRFLRNIKIWKYIYRFMFLFSQKLLTKRVVPPSFKCNPLEFRMFE